MKHYDLRVIENCLVYSYEVAAPSSPEETVILPKQHHSSARKRKKQMFKFRKLLLNLFLICLMPFAFILDVLTAAVRYIVNAAVFVLKSSKKYMPALSILSFLIFASALYYYL